MHGHSQPTPMARRPSAYCCGILDLPDELRRLIFSRLGFRDRARLSTVTRAFRATPVETALFHLQHLDARRPGFLYIYNVGLEKKTGGRIPRVIYAVLQRDNESLYRSIYHAARREHWILTARTPRIELTAHDSRPALRLTWSHDSDDRGQHPVEFAYAQALLKWIRLLITKNVQNELC